jgi:hypothetical protein
MFILFMKYNFIKFTYFWLRLSEWDTNKNSLHIYLTVSKGFHFASISHLEMPYSEFTF